MTDATHPDYTGISPELRELYQREYDVLQDQLGLMYAEYRAVRLELAEGIVEDRERRAAMEAFIARREVEIRRTSGRLTWLTKALGEEVEP